MILVYWMLIGFFGSLFFGLRLVRKSGESALSAVIWSLYVSGLGPFAVVLSWFFYGITHK